MKSRKVNRPPFYCSCCFYYWFCCCFWYITHICCVYRLSRSCASFKANTTIFKTAFIIRQNIVVKWPQFYSILSLLIIFMVMRGTLSVYMSIQCECVRVFVNFFRSWLRSINKKFVHLHIFYLIFFTFFHFVYTHNFIILLAIILLVSSFSSIEFKNFAFFLFFLSLFCCWSHFFQFITIYICAYGPFT